MRDTGVGDGDVFEATAVMSLPPDILGLGLRGIESRVRESHEQRWLQEGVTVLGSTIDEDVCAGHAGVLRRGTATHGSTKRDMWRCTFVDGGVAYSFTALTKPGRLVLAKRIFESVEIASVSDTAAASRCEDGAFSCGGDGKEVFRCRRGKFVATYVRCRGERGCSVSRDGELSCDQTIGAVGEMCSTNDAHACDAGRDVELRCVDGLWKKSRACAPGDCQPRESGAGCGQEQAPVEVVATAKVDPNAPPPCNGQLLEFRVDGRTKYRCIPRVVPPAP